MCRYFRFQKKQIFPIYMEAVSVETVSGNLTEVCRFSECS